ncbi:thioredoxin family protein [candidate division KSB1 bacterium]|nr:thioredoxin family protein [candidate division KSB1 bacterium]
MFFRISAALAFMYLIFTASTAMAQGPVDARILTAKAKAPADVRAGEKATLRIDFTIADEWHINSHKPRDEFSIPTVLLIDSTAGLNIHKIEYPQEKIIKFGFANTEISVYDGTETILCEFSFSESYPPGSTQIQAKLKYQGCNDKTCLPPADTLLIVNLQVNAGTENTETPAELSQIEKNEPLQVLKANGFLPVDKAHAGDTLGVVVVLDIEDDFIIGSPFSISEKLAPLQLQFEESPDARFEAVSFPAAEKRRFVSQTDTSEMHVYDWRVYLKSRLLISGTIAPGQYTLKGKATYQAYHHAQRMFLSDIVDQFVESDVDFKPSDALPTTDLTFEIPLEIVDKSIQPANINDEIFVKSGFGSSELRILKIIEKGVLLAILVFFIGGLLLNATPCVFPVIPITVSYFSAQGEQNRFNRFLVALAYVIGIALIFTILGLVSGLAGKQWGFLFQNTWFVVAIVMIMLALAASLFGAFEIKVPAALMTKLGQSREGFVGAFIMGLTIGVVIAPCAAGIIVALIILVAKLGMIFKGGILFFFMGLGLGLPYLFLATFTGLLNKLPKSGMWMVWIRKFFAIVMIGVAIYFLLPHTYQIEDVQSFYFGIIAIFAGLFLGFLDHEHGYTKGFKIGRAVFGLFVIALGMLWIDGATKSSKAATEMQILNQTSDNPISHVEWIYYGGEDIDQYLGTGQPVFIDFHAKWCAPCREMDKKTFPDPRIVEISKQFIMIKVDCTTPDQQTEALKKRFNALGMPTLIFIDANGNIRNDLRGVEFAGPNELLEKMKALLP